MDRCARIPRSARPQPLQGWFDWLNPQAATKVVPIEFLEWTPENRLRYPRFAGIRSDKDAWDIVRARINSM
jgi:hypothetical protein